MIARLRCRLLGHAWFVEVAPAPFAWRLCDRCHRVEALRQGLTAP